MESVFSLFYRYLAFLLAKHPFGSKDERSLSEILPCLRGTAYLPRETRYDLRGILCVPRETDS
jgi:hypothetical protein